MRLARFVVEIAEIWNIPVVFSVGLLKVWFDE
jgi:hypothetical protein